jgi:hypothetical protein
MDISYENKKVTLGEEEYFVASKDPLYYGLIINPSSELWGYMVEARDIECTVNNKLEKYNIPYRIDVGENSLFFITLAIKN